MRTCGLVVEAVLLERLHTGVDNLLSDHVIGHLRGEVPLDLELLAAVMDINPPFVNPVTARHGDSEGIITRVSVKPAPVHT